MSQLRTDTHKQNMVFAKVPTIKAPRSVFPIVKAGKTSHQFDILHPIFAREIMPGTTVNFTLDLFARLQTQVTDLFDDLYTDVHVWFNPHRLVQTNFARLFYNSQLTGPSQDNSSLTTPKITPYNDAGTYKFLEKSLFDDLEFPTKTSVNRTTGTYLHISNYKGRAYNNIWNLNYRDQNLQDAAVVDYDEGPDNYADYASHQYRGKRHDMPSSCLPNLMKGVVPSVPLIGTAPDITTGTVPQVRNQTTNPTTDRPLGSPGASQSIIGYGNAPATDQYLHWGSDTGLQVSFSSALAGFYLNDLRYTIGVQHLLEADARGGTRDVEALANVWSVEVADFRLDRPEYLGGSTFTFDGHIVPQSSETASTPQATLASFSQQRSSLRIMHSFVEPGTLMILVSHRSNQTYQNFWKYEDLEQTRWDFYNPFFANFGEVAVKKRYIFSTGVQAEDESIFGYQPYGWWLRYETNTVTREMRSNATNSLDAKHMAYDFSSTPVLGDEFIKSHTPIDRNITVDSSVADPITINFMISGSITQMLPMYSVPGMTRI